VQIQNSGLYFVADNQTYTASHDYSQTVTGYSGTLGLRYADSLYTDNVGSFTAYLYEALGISTVVGAFDVGQKNGNIVAVGGPAVYRSSNGATSFSSYIAQACYDLEIPYANNTSDANLLLWASNANLYLTTGATLGSAKLTESAAQNQWGRRLVYVTNGNYIYALAATSADTYSIKRSTNGGVTWETRSTGISAARALGLWPYNPNIVFLIKGSQVMASSDGGLTFINKNGNWSTVFGTSFANGVMVVPVWVV